MRTTVQLKFLVALLALLVAMPALANVQQVRVLAVGIDRSSQAAEAKALDYAQKRAVYLTAKRLQIGDADKKLQGLRAQQWKEIIRGASIVRTKRIGEYTYAEVNVTVVESALKRALDVEDALPDEDMSEGAVPPKMRGVLVLPVYVKNNRPYVWEEENLLRQPLQNEALRQGHGAVLVPASDLDDLRLVDYQNVLEVTSDELEPMFQRYGADEIVIAIVTMHAKPTDAEAKAETPKEPVSVLLRRLVPDGARSEILRLGDLSGATTTESKVERASRAIAAALVQIASSTAESEQEKLAKANKMTVTFRYGTTRDLAWMQERVRLTKGVLKLSVPVIALGDMKAQLYFTDTPDKLREKLAKQGIVITDLPDGWQLAMR